MKMFTQKQLREFTANPNEIKAEKEKIMQSDLSVDDKIVAITALKAELILHLQARGYKFHQPNFSIQ